jgi:putative ABC transport system permease protein
MFQNYLKVAWRNILNHRVYSILNVVGLAAGMVVALMIGLWIYSQYSYDRFLPAYDRLYQVKLNFNYNGQVQTQTGASLPMIAELRKNYPEVKYATETNWKSTITLIAGEKKINRYGLAVGEDFLKMFPYPMIKGNAATALSDQHSIIIAENVAKALFGDADPINKVVSIDNKDNLKVTGVMKDMPANSTLQFNYLLPYAFVEQDAQSRAARNDWTNYSSPEYIQLQEDADVAAFESKIKDICSKHDANHKIEVILQPAKNWRLLTGFENGKATTGLLEYVRIFGIVGLLVLIIACINFVNLSTARAEKRAREVGLRKSIGSTRQQLIFQFLAESTFIILIAFLLAFGLLLLLIPYFNQVTNSSLSVPYDRPMFWVVILFYVSLTSILAGSRPAFYLSSFQPVQVLKGTIKFGRRAALPRKVLVVFQFTCSIALIIATMVIYKQINFARNRPKGYDAEMLLMTNITPELSKNFEPLKNELLRSGLVDDVTTSGGGLTYFPASFTLTDWPGKQSSESLEMNIAAVSKDYFKTLRMTFLSGEDFKGLSVADTQHMILNQAAVEKLRLKNPINQTITLENSPTPMRIIGVVQNAVIGSPLSAAAPAIYLYNPGWVGTILYRLKSKARTQQAVASVGGIFTKYNPSSPFEYQFADEAFENTLGVETLVGTMARVFAMLAIFISCLGLFGLASYMAEQRKKEIAVRKVLGATVLRLCLLMSRDFLLLVGLSCLTAAPVAFYFLRGWLQKYDYRIRMGPELFLAAGLLSIVIAMVTISAQSISSATASPVKNLNDTL